MLKVKIDKKYGQYIRTFNLKYSLMPGRHAYFLFFMAKENRMDVHNLAIVFSPNIVYNSPTSSGPALMLMHMEWNNRLVEILLFNADIIFKD